MNPFVVLAGFTAATLSAAAWAGVLVGPGVHDFDGDGVTDASIDNLTSSFGVADNAVGTYNPTQLDSDMDQIGDDIDPTPFTPNPGPYPVSYSYLTPVVTVPVGGTALVKIHSTQLPYGNAGMLIGDVDGNGYYDSAVGVAFDAQGNSSFLVTPSYPLTASIDLNTPGTYMTNALQLYGSTYALSTTPQLLTIVVTPEPSTLLAMAAGVPTLLRRRTA